MIGINFNKLKVWLHHNNSAGISLSLNVIFIFFFSEALSMQMKLLHNIPLCLLEELSERF